MQLIVKVKELVSLGVDPEAIKRDDTKAVELDFFCSDLFIPGKIQISLKGINLLKNKLKNSLNIGGIKQIKDEGFSDDNELKKYPTMLKKYSNNLVLSVARAAAISRIINKEFRFPENLIVVTGYVDSQYLNSDKKKNKNFNNSVVITILKDKSIGKNSGPNINKAG